MIHDVEHLFLFISSSVKYLFISHTCYFSGLLVFLLSFENNLYILDASPLSYAFGNIFSQSVVYLCIFFSFLKFIYLFIYFWLRWVPVAARGLSLVAASGSYSSLRCAGFSLQWLLLLQITGSRHEGFSSCGAWTQ